MIIHISFNVCVSLSFFVSQNIQQELSAREATILTMKAPGNLPPVQSEDLSLLWERVTHLSDIRESKLKEGLKLVGEFSSHNSKKTKTKEKTIKEIKTNKMNPINSKFSTQRNINLICSNSVSPQS